MFSQFTGSTDFELSNLYTAERFLYSIGDSRGVSSHIPNLRRVRAITKTTSLDRLRLVFSSTRQSYKFNSEWNPTHTIPFLA